MLDKAALNSSMWTWYWCVREAYVAVWTPVRALRALMQHMFML